MSEDYVAEEEYPSYFGRLPELRERIARTLPVEKGMRILDLATGYGFFALAIARQWEDVVITGIDLTEPNVRNARDKVASSGLSSRFSVRIMDATDMRFRECYFDMVVNFLGLGDIHMTRGREGVSQTFREVFRVLERGGHFCFVAMPPEEAETNTQKTEIEVFSNVLALPG